MTRENLSENLDYLVSLAEKLKRGQVSSSEGKRQIVWGIMTALGFLATQVLVLFFSHGLWWILAVWVVVIGFSFVISATIKADTDTTQVFLSRAIGNIWVYLTMALCLFPVAIVIEALVNEVGALPMAIPLGEMAFLSIAAGTMGVLLRLRYFKFVAMVGFFLMFICALLPLWFGIWFAIMQTLLLTVPGVKIIKSAKRSTV